MKTKILLTLLSAEKKKNIEIRYNIPLFSFIIEQIRNLKKLI